MICITEWMDEFLQKLTDVFGDRVWFVGLQGSYGRGEATEASDIDPVVILNELSPSDLEAYGVMLDRLPHRERICGFLSGKAEILNWESADLFQFYYDTTPILGSLDELLPLIDDAAVRRAILVGACNLFHGCVHNMLHEKSDRILRKLYKSASFTVQAIVFWQTGRYIKQQAELLAVAAPEEREILKTFERLKQGEAVDFDAMSKALFAWSKKWIDSGDEANFTEEEKRCSES